MSGIEVTRQSQVLVDNGYMYMYMYVFDAGSADGTKRFWRCRKRNVCNARIHTYSHNNNVVKRINEHSQDSEVATTETKIGITKIKQKSQRTLEST